jgi:hypothetical protein
MSKFLNLTVDFLAYDSATATNDPADADKIKRSISDTISQFSRPSLAIADATVDQVISLPAASCDYLLVFVDQIVTLKINGDAGKSFKPTASGKKTCVLVMRGAITALSVSNASGATANVDVIAAKI